MSGKHRKPGAGARTATRLGAGGAGVALGGLALVGGLSGMAVAGPLSGAGGPAGQSTVPGFSGSGPGDEGSTGGLGDLGNLTRFGQGQFGNLNILGDTLDGSTADELFSELGGAAARGDGLGHFVGLPG